MNNLSLPTVSSDENITYSWPQMKVYRNSTEKRKRKKKINEHVHTNINAERLVSQLSKVKEDLSLSNHPIAIQCTL